MTGETANRDDLPVVLVVPEIASVCDRAEDLLVENARAELFQRGSLLVRVQRGDGLELRDVRSAPDAPRIVAVAAAYLRELLDRIARWAKPARGNQTTPALVPKLVPETLLVRGEWKLDTLLGVTETARFRADGSVLAASGYDPRTGLLFEPLDGLPTVPDEPTDEDVLRAVETLHEPFADFPFLDATDRAAAIAAALTLLARPAIAGPCPLFAVRAYAPGTGKTLLVDVVGLIGTGRAPPCVSPRKDDAEMRKLILALGLEGAPVVLLDNVAGLLGSESLAAALTKTEWSDRILGRSETAVVPLHAVWFATGNGLAFKGDLGRRVVPIDLDAGVEHPEDRTGFAHTDLRAWVRANRPRLVAAGLTILRAYHLAGRPAHGTSKLGSFEPWDDLVRGACVWAGIGDPNGGRERIREEGDADLDVLRTLLAEWWACFEAEPGTSAEIAGRAAEVESLASALIAAARSRSDRVTTDTVGRAVRRFRGRVVDGLRLARASKSRGSNRWCVEEVPR